MRPLFVPLLLALLVPSLARAMELIGLGRFGIGTYSAATAVSADGRVVVGYSENSDSIRHAFRWTRTGGLQDLDDLPGGSDDSVATGVSRNGSVIVGQGSAAGQKAFRWTAAGGMQEFVDSTELSAAGGVSGDGAVAVGYSAVNLVVQRAAAWRPDGLGGFERDTLAFLPGGTEAGLAYAASFDGSILVGYSSSASSGLAGEAALWNASGVTPLGDLEGGAFASEARGVSSDGSVVAGVGNSAAGREAFRWTEADGLVALGDLPGGAVDSAAQAISADGSTIVGSSQTAPGVYHAFVWDAVNGMRDLHELAGAADQEWLLYAANGVSADGSVIVGEGTAPDGNPEAWLLQVPEPGAAFATFGSGAALAALRLRRHVARR